MRAHRRTSKTPRLSGVVLAVLALPTAASDPAGDGAAAHAALLLEKQYPSAKDCAACHQRIYEEWSSSAHAYAAISPMFHKFEQRINELANGTIGSFCVRCHISVGTAMDEKRWLPLWERAPVSVEGVTCITCHRVEETYGRVNGERRIVPGTINDPVFGPTGAPGLDGVVQDARKWGVDPFGVEGTPIHRDALAMPHIGKSEFCASCHQVAVHPGIKLEVVWEQYRDSPAFEEGTSCQDCHMSSEPGLPSGYSTGPRAVVNQTPTEPQDAKHTDHSFVGPGYSIAHPGIFPHNARNRYELDEWMSFDWRAGWGEPGWEREHAGRAEFPEEWRDREKRAVAREIVEENVRKLAERNERRRRMMETGSKIDGPFFSGAPRRGRELEFEYVVRNISTGHNLPSGSLGAQPEIWLNVALTDPDGKNVWESGYVDSRGDMADLHSRDVLAGRLAHDGQLFNLQSKFLTTNVKGTDREMFLPVPFDGDQLPFIRPAGQPTSVMNHPPFIRMEQRSIPPLGRKHARYSVPGELLEKPGTYRLSVRLRSRAEPIYFMDFVGSTEEMVREMNRHMIDIHPYTVAFEVR
jgi:hypothetical protein